MKIYHNLTWGILLFCLISILITTTPAYGEPQIYFQPINWYADDVINFYGTNFPHRSESPSEIIWDFGDGEIGIGHNTSHQYDNYGKYEIKLKIKYSDGVEFTDSKRITVFKTLESFDFSVSPVQHSFSSGQSFTADVDYVNNLKKDTPISFTCLPPIPNKTTCTIYPPTTSKSQQNLKVFISTSNTLSSGQYPYKIIANGQGIVKCDIFTAHITKKSLSVTQLDNKNSATPIDLESLLENTKSLDPTKKCADFIKEKNEYVPYNNPVFKSFQADKLNYDIPENSRISIKISGKIHDDKYVENTNMVITIKDPLGDKHRILTPVISPGVFGKSWLMDPTSPIGIYEIQAMYGNSYSEKSTFQLTYDGDSIPTQRVIQYKVYLDLPEEDNSTYLNAIFGAFTYWKEHIPIVKFNIVPLAHESDFYIQWASEYEEGKLGYVDIDPHDRYYAAVTTGNFFYNNIWVELDQKDLEKIATHEIGHIIGMRHISNPNDIMHSTINLNDDENLRYPFLTQNEIVQPSKFIALTTEEQIAFKIVELLNDPHLNEETKIKIIENLPEQIYNKLRDYE